MYTNVLEYLETNSNIENSACALSDEKAQVTYGQLKELAQRTGSFIAKQGTRTGRPIAVLIDRNVWSIVLFMGIVYSGNFYVPIDPTMPAKRIELILDTLQPVMILSAAEGKTIDEIAKWAEENKLHVCHNVTVDDLNHLQRGGRISKAAAVLGTLVQVKPIIHMDNNGKLQVIAKERGRKKSLNKIVDMAVEQSKGWENEIIMITHGDCLKDAEYVAGRVREKMGIENILINNIGTVIGSHTGPGVVAVFCMGNER